MRFNCDAVAIAAGPGPLTLLNRSGSCDLEIAHMAHRLVEELYPFIASSRLGLSKKGFTPQMISEFISGKLRPSNFDPRKSNLRRLQSGGTVVG